MSAPASTRGLQETAELTGELVDPPRTEAPPRIRLTRSESEKISKVVEGAVLERQYRLEEGRLLVFLTDDVPYEETLRVLLLDRNLETLDGLVFGGAYATGTLEDVQVLDPRTIAFSFVHKGPVHLRVGESPKWRRPALGVPGVRRMGFGFGKRYLSFRLTR